MKGMLGHGASTGTYRDWIGSDLIVFFGSNVPNNQPVTTKYLYEAKKKGARIAVVNPYREPGLEAYWVPSVFESAVFGTRLADDWFEVDTGGDLAFLAGVFKALIEIPGGVDRTSCASARPGSRRPPPRRRGLQLGGAGARRAAASRDRMRDFARLLRLTPNANFVWSMGLTQHAHGVDTVRALVNVGLARGLPGRPLRRPHADPRAFGGPGRRRSRLRPSVEGWAREHWSEIWGFAVRRPRGPERRRSRSRPPPPAEIDVFWMVGGNFLETLPDAARGRAALQRPRLRIHQDIVLSSAMLVEPSDTVLLLPAATRYETPGGVTETSTERRIIFSPEIPGRRIAGARPEWEVFRDVCARVWPERAGVVELPSTATLREEMARAIPLYRGIETLSAAGEQVQWGGPQLYADGRFATPDGKAQVHAFPPAAPSRGRRALPALDPTGQAVQLHGAARPRSARPGRLGTTC